MLTAAATVIASFLVLAAPAAPPEGAGLVSQAVRLDPPVLATSEGGIAGGAVSLRVRGRFVFQRTVEAVPATVGGARMRVEIWDEDAIVDEMMWETETDAQGFFDTTFLWDDCDITGCDDPDLYIVVRAINDEQDIQRDSFLQTTWAWSSSDAVIEDITATDIQLGTLQPADPEEMGAVHLHTVLALSRDTLQPIGFPVLFPLLEVDWSPDADATELDGTRLSVSAADAWSELVIAREHLLFVYEQKTGEQLASLCNGICDTNGCSYCLWCIEPPEAAWRVGAATWYGDALSRSLTSVTGAAPLVTLPEIDATFPCADGLPSEIRWVPGYAAAILRDLEDTSETLDIDGDGIDDAPAETSCERDSLARGLTETVERLFIADHRTIDEFVDYLWSTALPRGPLWRTLRRIGGDVWTEPDTDAPFILFANSLTHPGGVGPTPFVTIFVGGDDDGSGISGASVVWSPSPSESVDEIVDVVAQLSGSIVTESPAIPYAGVLYLHIRVVDCVGNWSNQSSFGPIRVTDCDGDGIPDFCATGGCDELPGYCPPEVCGTVEDCNGNLVPDACELASGTLDDCNNDGIPDICQGLTNAFSPPLSSTEALWNTASNWTLGTAPNASQIACLDLGVPSYLTRLQGASATVLGFACDHRLEVLSTLTSATPSHAHRIDLMGGTLTGTGNLAITDLRWMTGTISRAPGSSPSLTVGSFTTIGNFSKSLSRDTIVAQTLNHDAGQLSLGEGRTLTIADFAEATIRANTSISWGAGSQPSIVNRGTLRKIAPGNATVQFVPIANEGTIEVAEGRLDFAGGVSTGTMTIDPAATLALQNGTLTLQPGATLEGARFELNGGTALFGGTVDLDTFAVGLGSPVGTLLPSGAFTAGTTTIAGGTLDGLGSLVTDSLVWTGGTVLGGANAAPFTTEILTFTGAGQKNLRRTLIVTGDATSDANTVGISEGGLLSLRPDASLELVGNASFTWITGGAPGSIVNEGTIRRSGAGLTTFTFVGLTNHGLIDISAGTLRLTGSSSHTGAVSGASTLEIGGGAHAFGATSLLDVGQLSITNGSLNAGGAFAPTSTTMSGGTLTVSGPGFQTTDALTISSGTLDGPGSLTVTGPLNWTSGFMQGSGTTAVVGVATLSGPAAKSLRRTLVANETLVVSSANIGVNQDGQMLIPVGSELILTSGSALTWTAGNAPGTISVGGTLRKANDGGSGTISFAPLTVTGPTVIESGTLQLNGPCTINGPVTGAPGSELAVASSSPQSFSASANASLSTLRLTGSQVSFAAPVTAQSVLVTNGSTSFNAATTAGDWLQQNSSSIGGTGAITIDGSFTFTGGTLAGGNATLDALGPALLSTGSSRTIARTVRLHGPAQWSGGSLAVNTGGQLRIMPSGSLDIAGPSLQMTWSASAPGTFANEGTLRTLAGSGTTNVFGVAWTNAGVVDLDGATLRFSGAPDFVQTAGSLTVRAGREFEHTGSLVLNGGSLGGGGLVDANLLVGNATIAPGDGVGTLTIEGTVSFNATSTLALTIGSSERDQLAVTGALTCGGTIAVSLTDGFAPEIGDSFVVVTCGSRSGTFASAIATTPLPSDRRWAIQHNPTNVTLVVVPALPCAGDLDLDGSVGPTDLALLLGAWGTDGLATGADINEDGVVSAPDLAILLGAWGPCPAGFDRGATDGGVASSGGSPRDERAMHAERRSGTPRRLGAGPESPDASDSRRSLQALRVEPTIIEGDLFVDAESALDRAIELLLPEPSAEGCMTDATLLVIEGHAMLDGILRVTLADDLEIIDGMCLRILVAKSIAGTPTVEVIHRGRPLRAEPLLAETTLDLVLAFDDTITE
jgi:hypothetical protein